ncbi:DUF3306 domain-containing protein [Vibrio sp. SCSIO 43136]|uniref:DUF3306 domain-containing protein n=1 Tax=Vibrio sp. SCSIO 43136 TaxID=2819101 RepID=UPI00207636EB|nr:DUF3306 domain-containing protein [Vibrio sp. SCSIO 43136]USD66572.1 DUF3306 domain-containing protein [Vibrio sp. SCSIO 43136]
MSFFKRWSERKIESDKTPQQSKPNADDSKTNIDESADVVNSGSEAVPALEEAPLEQEATLAAMLVEGVDKQVKKAAMRKLFLSGEFSEVDGLNDYDHDYKAVKNLSSEVAEKLRDWAKEHIEEEPQDEENNETSDINESKLPDDDVAPTEASDKEVGQNVPHSS